MALDDSRFATLADAVLLAILEAVDESGGELEAELQSGILTITHESGRQYVVNKHGPKREIWLSSPVSGAWHFAFDEGSGQWRDTRAADRATAAVLADLLSRELSEMGGAPVRLS
ncbi:MAG: iron donor protein CyaY [Alphaproteobacteria bacterium]